MDTPALIRRAFYDAQSRRPYKSDVAIIKAVIPPGGDWSCVAAPGAICRSVMWGGTEVAHVNPGGRLGDTVEGEIAMAIRSLPAMDAALRAIIVLAESAENLAAIRDLAVSVIAYTEEPAPPTSRPDEPEEDDDEERRMA